MKSLLGFMLLACVGVGAFNLTPPANTWVVLGQSFNLSCKSSSPALKSCSWTTPYGKNYPLSEGLTAEGGRFRHLGEEDTDCGIVVAGAEERDLGSWTCLVSVVNGSEVTPAQGHAKVFEARVPDDVSLFGPFENGSGVVNISRSDKVDIDCVVNSAKPKPEVSWFVGETELEGSEMSEKEDGDVYVYRLAYSPDPWHENKNLKCVVKHVSLEREREASVLVVFNDLVSTGESVDEEGSPATEDMSYYIVAILGLLVSLACGSILVSYMKGWLCFRKSTQSLEVADGEAKLAEPGESTGSSDGKSEDKDIRAPSVAGRSVSERVASFFRWGPSRSSADPELGKDAEEAIKGAEDGVDETETKAKFSEKLGALFKKGGCRNGVEVNEEKGEQDVERNEKSCWAGICNAGNRRPSKGGSGAAAEGNVNEAVEEKQVEYEPEEKTNGHVASSSPVHTSV